MVALGFPPSVLPESRFMVVLTAYLDASGNNDGRSDTVTVAGFVSNEANWTAFYSEWERALIDLDIPIDPVSGVRMFHMSKFAPKAAPYDEEHGWTEQRRRDCMDKLLGIITERAALSVGACVPLSLYDSLLSAPVKRALGGPYGMAAQMLIPNVGLYVHDRNPDPWINYVFESGDDGRDQVQRVFDRASRNNDLRERFRPAGIEFRDKRMYLPLQAADIIAYELRLFWSRQTSGDNARYPLKKIGETLPRMWNVADERLMRETDEQLRGLLGA